MIKSTKRENINHNKKIIELLVDADILLEGPYTTSSARALIPVAGYIERIFAFPEIYQPIVNEMANYLKKKDVDCILGCDMIGVLFAGMIAYEMKVPFCAIRREKPNHGVATHLAGTIPDNVRNVALVDDWNGSWSSIFKFYNIAREYGVKPNCIVSVIESFEDKGTRDKVARFLEENDLDSHAFCTFRDIVDEYVGRRMITKDAFKIVDNFIKDYPSYLVYNKNMDTYLELKKNGKTFQNLPKTKVESLFEII